MSKKTFEIYFFHNSGKIAIKKVLPFLDVFVRLGQTWSYLGSSSRGGGGNNARGEGVPLRHWSGIGSDLSAMRYVTSMNS